MIWHFFLKGWPNFDLTLVKIHQHLWKFINIHEHFSNSIKFRQKFMKFHQFMFAEFCLFEQKWSNMQNFINIMTRMSNFARFLIKSMVKIIWIFNAFSTRRFINCFLNLLISSMLETWKIVIFRRENAFYKISFFAFDVKGYRTCAQN